MICTFHCIHDHFYNHTCFCCTCFHRLDRRCCQFLLCRCRSRIWFCIRCLCCFQSCLCLFKSCCQIFQSSCRKISTCFFCCLVCFFKCIPGFFGVLSLTCCINSICLCNRITQSFLCFFFVFVNRIFFLQSIDCILYCFLCCCYFCFACIFFCKYGFCICDRCFQCFYRILGIQRFVDCFRIVYGIAKFCSGSFRCFVRCYGNRYLFFCCFSVQFCNYFYFCCSCCTYCQYITFQSCLCCAGIYQCISVSDVLFMCCTVCCGCFCSQFQCFACIYCCHLDGLVIKYKICDLTGTWYFLCLKAVGNGHGSVISCNIYFRFHTCTVREFDALRFAAVCETIIANCCQDCFYFIVCICLKCCTCFYFFAVLIPGCAGCIRCQCNVYRRCCLIQCMSCHCIRFLQIIRVIFSAVDADVRKQSGIWRCC